LSTNIAAKTTTGAGILILTVTIKVNLTIG